MTRGLRRRGDSYLWFSSKYQYTNSTWYIFVYNMYSQNLFTILINRLLFYLLLSCLQWESFQWAQIANKHLQNNLRHQTNPLTFHYTGCLIGIPMMVLYNPHVYIYKYITTG